MVLILDKVDRGEHVLCNSAALVVENSLSPRTQVRLEIDELLERADIWIAHDKAIDERAVVTCDDHFLKAARRNAARITVTVTDPIRLVSEGSS